MNKYSCYVNILDSSYFLGFVRPKQDRQTTAMDREGTHTMFVAKAQVATALCLQSLINGQ